MSRKLTREDVANLFNDAKLTKAAKHEIIQGKLKIPNIDPNLDGEPLVDAVFTAYEKALADLESKKTAKKAIPSPAATPTTSSEREEGGGESRKDIIINVIKEAKSISMADLIADIDQRCGYAARGKTSRTRVGRVIKDLIAENRAENVNGTIKMK
jgi:hypothetical protein